MTHAQTRSLHPFRAPFLTATVACLALIALPVAPAFAEAPLAIANVHSGPSMMVFEPQFAVESSTLTVSGPSGDLRYEFDGRTQPSLGAYDADGYPLADGTYTWELRVLPELGRQMQDELATARATGDMSRIDSLRTAGQLPNEPLVQSGSFAIAGGGFVDGSLVEPMSAPIGSASAAASSGPAGIQSTSAAAQVIADDLIVDGSQCVGIDCASNESFGFDTLRLKENNLRIKFDDTSGSGSFPNNDWQLTANDSSNGGKNRFSIDDVTGGKTPFTIEAGAPNNALYIDPDGDLGVGTATPALELHVVDGDTPTLRLEQDGSSGFQSQTWDVAGNETNFFIRDVTGGSKLPFKIFPGSPDDTLTVDDAGNGRVGVGTKTPDSSLHVRGTDGDTALHVQEASGSAGSRRLMTLTNNGQLLWSMVRTDDNNSSWNVTHNGSTLTISKGGTGANEMSLDDSGNVEFRGTVTGDVASPSARALKTDFAALDPRAILAKVADLPVLSWRYKADTDGQRVHLGPMADDFHAAFGVGADDRIFLADVNGVALAAIQGLHEVVDEVAAEKDAALAELQAENEALSSRLEALEAMVSALTAN